MLLHVVVWSSVSLSYGYRYETLHLCLTDTPPSSSLGNVCNSEMSYGDNYRGPPSIIQNFIFIGNYLH